MINGNPTFSDLMDKFVSSFFDILSSLIAPAILIITALITAFFIFRVFLGVFSISSEKQTKPRKKRKISILDISLSQYLQSIHIDDISRFSYLEHSDLKLHYIKKYEKLKSEALTKRFNKRFAGFKRFFHDKIEKIISFDMLETFEDLKKVKTLASQIQTIHKKYENKHLSLYKN